jgi:hypothetical protein
MKLHIIAFDIPFPPNYGGVIDVFYKIKTLSEQGVAIILHCFEYNRKQAPELENYCEQVFYYQRHTGLLTNLSFLPYIVLSRKNDGLLNNLLQDSYPILFEGLHSCYYLNDKRLSGRFKVYRESNIEHVYYYHLFRSQRNFVKSVFYLIESIRLYFYQRRLKTANLMLAVSQEDTAYLRRHFSENAIDFLSSFHANTFITGQAGRGDYALYHGNLAVEENETVALFLLQHVFRDLPFRLVIAGRSPSDHLKKVASFYPHVQVYDSPDEPTMQALIHNAHLHVMITFQATGLKLKLLNALYSGRFCLANKQMLWGTGLDELCVVSDTAEEMKKTIIDLFNENYLDEYKQERIEKLRASFSNEENGRRLLRYLVPVID